MIGCTTCVCVGMHSTVHILTDEFTLLCDTTVHPHTDDTIQHSNVMNPHSLMNDPNELVYMSA